MKNPTVRKKRKRNESDEIAELEKQIRELKSTVRALQRRLRKVDKEYKRNPSLELEELVEEMSTPIDVCPSCHRGQVTESIILNRRLRRCDICGWRGKTEKI